MIFGASEERQESPEYFMVSRSYHSGSSSQNILQPPYPDAGFATNHLQVLNNDYNHDYLNNDSAPKQFSENVWFGNLTVLQNPDFFKQNNNIKLIINFMPVNKISKQYMENNDLLPKDSCVLVVDNSFDSDQFDYQTSNFILQYQPIFDYLNSSNIHSPVINIKNKLLLIENIINIIENFQNKYPKNSGILILHDEESERFKRYSILLSVAFLLNKDLNTDILEAMVTLRNHTAIIDNIFLNNKNFFDTLQQFRLKITAINKFQGNSSIKRPLPGLSTCLSSASSSTTSSPSRYNSSKRKHHDNR